MKKLLHLYLFLMQGVLLVADEEGHTTVNQQKTKTPIKHLVIIIPESCSFDHFFGTYPKSGNLPGEICFSPKKNSPLPNGLSEALIRYNNNLFPPFRSTRADLFTNEPAHQFSEQQELILGGLLDRFVQINQGDHTPMAYFDGNTVTALWNYAQRFSMNDNCFSTTRTTSTPGHINLISGKTQGAIPTSLSLDSGEIVVTDGTLIGNADPAFDIYSNPPTVELTGKNIGDLLNARKVTWGYFQGGFRNNEQSHLNSQGVRVLDYAPQHQPFQYYQSTSNPNHLPPSSVEMIGLQDQANHQYDLSDFLAAVKSGHIPAVSFIKPSEYQDGHPKYSDPLALQFFLVHLINRLQKTPEWKEMAIVIVWSHSGGWYDHVMPPTIHRPAAAVPEITPELKNADIVASKGNQSSLAYGMRIPLLVISPFSRVNFIDHSMIDQTSVLRFIEDNWYLRRIGEPSFDEVASTLEHLFDFKAPNPEMLLLNTDSGSLKRTKK